MRPIRTFVDSPAVGCSGERGGADAVAMQIGPTGAQPVQPLQRPDDGHTDAARRAAAITEPPCPAPEDHPHPLTERVNGRSLDVTA